MKVEKENGVTIYTFNEDEVFKITEYREGVFVIFKKAARLKPSWNPFRKKEYEYYWEWTNKWCDYTERPVQYDTHEEALTHLKETQARKEKAKNYPKEY